MHRVGLVATKCATDDLRAVRSRLHYDLGRYDEAERDADLLRVIAARRALTSD